jgi:hypothetical protein
MKRMRHEYTVEAKVTLIVTEENIEDIIISGLEGVCSYWLGLDNSDQTIWGKKVRPLGDDEQPLPLSVFVASRILNGYNVSFYDIEEEDETSGSELWQLDLTKLLKGISKVMSLGYIREADDLSDYADEIFQYALFDEIVYA